MNPSKYRWALTVVAIAAAAYLAGLAFFALSGCAAELPEETGWTVTTTADAAYQGPR